ncbi:MAG: M23 family metallopeptidase [Maledivibacter sp.]|jgi:murein DD-endopeptidase MepM/ murein hydrolase activator NlpD|nr:M23 family metallopeptidase [Maledivibacter sp.]
MKSRTKYLLKARIRSRLIKKRKRRFISFKGIIVSLLILLIPMLIMFILNISEQKPSDVYEIRTQKDLYIPNEYLKKAYTKANSEGISFPKLLTYSANEADFAVEAYTDKVLRNAVKLAKKNEEMTKPQKALYDIYAKVFDDLRVGPIPNKKEIYIWNENKNKWEMKDTEEYCYISEDDFGAARSYGGDRTHEGNDLIADLGTPIVSMTDGEITRIGWLEYGGQRIGITTSKGTYFYYAHMDRYAEGMVKGKKVRAGDIIGYIGDTGYGPPGTKGKFPPHLHVQIGFRRGEFSKGYTWFNPYDIVKFLDDYRVTLVEKKN